MLCTIGFEYRQCCWTVTIAGKPGLIAIPPRCSLGGFPRDIVGVQVSQRPSSRQHTPQRQVRVDMREPAVAQLASAAVSGRLPAGPQLRQRPPLALRGQPGVNITAPLSVTEMGFSLHAATTASADDARGREATAHSHREQPPTHRSR